MLDSGAFGKPNNRPSEPRTALEPTSLRRRATSAMLSPRTLPALLVVLGIGLATFVLYLYVLPNSQIDAAKVHIAELQAQQAALARENAAVMQEIARASNLKTLEVRARALGMAPAKSTIYLRLPGSEPAPVDAPSATAAGGQTEDIPVTLADWLQREHMQELLRDFRQRVSHTVESVIQRFRTD